MKLGNYSLEKPVVNEEAPVLHPTRKDTVMGWAGDCNREGRGFVARRTRYDNDGGQDYYRKVGGYSMVIKTLQKLEQIGVKTIFIQETDNARLIEYGIEQFLEGEKVEDWKGDEQLCLPVDNCRAVWEDWFISAGSEK